MVRGGISMKEEKVKISGMTCTACASRVERVINKLEGVSYKHSYK